LRRQSPPLAVADHRRLPLACIQDRQISIQRIRFVLTQVNLVK
jgi:hypothetical protein